jgi:hypothetical protein
VSVLPLLFTAWNYYGDHEIFAPYDKLAIAVSTLIAALILSKFVPSAEEMRRHNDARRGD